MLRIIARVKHADLARCGRARKDNRKGKLTDRAETEQAGDDVVTEGTWHQKSPSWGAWGDGKSARRSAAQSRPASARKACANAAGSRPPPSSGSSVASMASMLFCVSGSDADRKSVV